MDPIELHYNTIEEKDRLSRGLGQLEAERTRIIIKRFLAPPPANILDVGGGAGVYAFWLAAEGHNVTLIDYTPKHVEQAKALQEQRPHKLAGITQGDARDLSVFAAGSCDMVLLLGPLYHLTEKEDRLKALKEACRVLKPGGTILAAGIQRYASLFDGLSRGLIDDPYFENILRQDLKDGQHRNPQNTDQYFTTAYFQPHAEMREEMIMCGFSISETVAVEGPLWLTENFAERWNDAEKKQQLLDVVQLVEHEENLMNVTLHYLVAAKKE
jgi:ubiquinone/menaquinone biosynthesis C-methylase UbiE